MRLTDGIKLGSPAFQHHDPSQPLAKRNYLFGYRQVPSDDKNRLNKPTGEAGSMAQAFVTMNLWPAVPGARPFGGWSESWPVVISRSFGEPQGTSTNRGGFLMLPDSGDGIPDDTFEEKIGPDVQSWVSRYPGGWTGTVTSGTDPDIEIDTFHPDALALVANNRGADGIGTNVVDLTPENQVDADRFADLNTLVSVENIAQGNPIVPGSYLALQMGEIGSSNAGPESGLLLTMQREDRRTLLTLSSRMGGPLIESTPRYEVGRTDDGVPVRPAALSVWTLFSDPSVVRSGRLRFVNELGFGFDGTYGLPFGIEGDLSGNLVEAFPMWDPGSETWRIMVPMPMTPSVPGPPTTGTRPRPPITSNPPHPNVPFQGLPVGPVGPGQQGGGPLVVNPARQAQQGLNPGGGGGPAGPPIHTKHGRRDNQGDLFEKYKAKKRREEEAYKKRLEERINNPKSKAEKEFAERALKKLQRKQRARENKIQERINRRQRAERRRQEKIAKAKAKREARKNKRRRKHQRSGGETQDEVNARFGLKFGIQGDPVEVPSYDMPFGFNFLQAKIKAEPWRDGERLYYSGGGMNDATAIATIGGIGVDPDGSGPQQDNKKDGSAAVGSGSVVFLPGGVSINDYIRAQAIEGVTLDDATTAVSVAVPTGQSQFVAGELDYTTGQPKNGIAIKGTDVGGGEIVLVDSGGGYSSGIGISFDETGITVSADKVHMDGYLDPSGVGFSDQNGGGAPTGSTGDALIFYDSTLNTRPQWREDNVAGDNTAHTLAYLTDVPTVTATGGNLLAVVAGIDLTATGATNLYECPTGDVAHITRVVLRVTSANTVTAAAQASVDIDTGGTIISSMTWSSLDTGKTRCQDADLIKDLVDAGEFVRLNVGTGATATALVVTAYVFGFLESNATITSPTYQTYQFTGDRFAVGDTLLAFGYPDTLLGSGSVGPDTIVRAAAVTEAGNVVGLSWISTVTTGAATLRLWVSGVDTGKTVDIDLASSTRYVTFPTHSVSQGDRLALEWDAGVDPGDASVTLVVENFTDQGPQAIWAAFVNTANYHLRAGSGQLSGSEVSGLDYRSELVVPIDCELSAFSISHSAGDGTTDWGIVKNGSLATSFNNVDADHDSDNVSGTVSVAAGDTFAVRNTGGTTPEECRALVSFSGLKGLMVQFGGHAAAGDDFYEPYNDPEGGCSDSTPSELTVVTVPKDCAGSIYVGLRCQLTSGSVTLNVVKNGSTADTITLTVASGKAYGSAAVTFDQGDTLGIALASGSTNPQDCNILVYCAEEA